MFWKIFYDEKGLVNGNGSVESGDIKGYHNFIGFDFLLAYEGGK